MKWLRLLTIYNPSKGYKVNITQSGHQTITVSQSSSTNKTTGFTIEYYPTIDISLKADPGYIAGVLNHTSFIFSNDIREVNILATAASYSPNITYNGNMNVFLSTYLSTTTKIFEIVYNIDSSNTYGFTSSLNGGLAYVLWLFYAYYAVIMVVASFGAFSPETPIISTIPVNITFTKVEQ